MLECLIIGDSIAVGTKMFAPKECVSYAKGGWNTWQWNQRYGGKDLAADTVVISLGTNDHAGINTEKELRKMRANVTAKRVVWILPPCNKKFCKSNINAIVTKIARQHGDIIVGTPYLQTDGIHPSWRGYRDLVTKAKI